MFNVVGKGWPIAFGLGTGTGMAISNCQHEFRRMFSPVSPASLIIYFPQVDIINRLANWILRICLMTERKVTMSSSF